MDTANGWWRWPAAIAVTGTVLIGLGAFWLSFTALADLAARSGIPPGRAWVWPLLVDGLIVVATIAVFALDQLTGGWYAWTLLISGALVSVAANILHAFVAADATVPAVLAAVVAAVPPLVLLASTHLTVVLIRSTNPAPSPPASTSPDPEVLTATAEVTSGATPSVQDPQASPASSEETPAPSPKTPPADGYDRAIDLHARNWSNVAIAGELNVHPSTIGRWLARHHQTSEPNTTDDTDRAKKERS